VTAGAAVFVRDSRDGAIFSVRVSPRASRNAISGLLGEGEKTTLKIALHAPPVDGRANAALIEFLAQVFDVPRAAIGVVSGQQSRNKVVCVHGRRADEIAHVLAGELARIDL
jgi:uncharacterized protein